MANMIKLVTFFSFLRLCNVGLPFCSSNLVLLDAVGLSNLASNSKLLVGLV